jgi:hypothetical protein
MTFNKVYPASGDGWDSVVVSSATIIPEYTVACDASRAAISRCTFGLYGVRYHKQRCPFSAECEEIVPVQRPRTP